MSKISSLMDMGKRSLQNSQTGLQTTAHNIAQRGTEGYSRQRVDLVHAPPVSEGTHRLGTGAKIMKIQSVRNDYLEKQIEKEAQKGGFHNSVSDGVARTEQIFNEQQNKGLNRFVGEFFNAYRELTNAPESLAARTLVKESGLALTEDFQRIHKQLIDIQKDLDYQITSEVSEINGMTEEIAGLNKKITMVEVQGGHANDERDRRNVLLKHLGEKIDMKYAENDEGQVQVMAGHNAVLVSGYEHTKLSTGASIGKNGIRQGNVEILFHPSPSSEAMTVDITGQIKNGSIGGALDVRDHLINELHGKMDALAFTIAKEVNNLHMQGNDRYGNPGILFFDILEGPYDASSNIKINDSIQADVGKITAGYSENGPGDNRLANKIAGLQYEGILGNNTASVDEYYNGMVGELAVVAKQSNMRKEHQTNIVKQLENVRESISGVSLDEETTKMLELQKSFDASARMIKTADEMLETVLNIKRM